MAFSLRKIISNISYFKKPEETQDTDQDVDKKNIKDRKTTENINFERLEPDSTSRQCHSLKLPEKKKISTKKSSLSDTDLLKINFAKQRRKSKKLKLDIRKANQSLDNIALSDSNENVENTPKHILLESKTSEVFNERFKLFDFDQSFDLYDETAESASEEDHHEIASLSDTDISLPEDDKANIKMCRKVGENENDSGSQLIPSVTPESFVDVEIDKNEEERMNLLLNYQMKLDKIENFLKKLLADFRFHIEVSKILQCRAIAYSLPKTTSELTYDSRSSPTESWHVILEREDYETKYKLKKQLFSIKHCVDRFIKENLINQPIRYASEKNLFHNKKKLNDVHKTNQKYQRTCKKKKLKHFDYPDHREALINLFKSEDVTDANYTILSDFNLSDISKCGCRCHSEGPQTDSGLTSKSEEQSLSITSSIGNFSLDSTTLTAYSESLDQIVSYNSFHDTSLFSTLLQKAAIERITFYVQVHSIQLNCEPSDEYESKNIITFHCPSCKITESDENGLLKHILSDVHCEKIHFVYKTAYIKKCVQSGKEIQPSTVLNPMTMYRDDNKIVCFGDAMYACSLCFENLIVGESILMAHCSEPTHIDRRDKLNEIFE